jgi:hypothetical protein
VAAAVAAEEEDSTERTGDDSRAALLYGISAANAAMDGSR